MKTLIAAAVLALIGQADACECFANGQENEAVCEEGARPTYDSCVNGDGKCHWGPGEDAACSGPPVQEEGGECQCFANGEENEQECEGGNRPDVGSCIGDDKCHWGPGEIPEC